MPLKRKLVFLAGDLDHCILTKAANQVLVANTRTKVLLDTLESQQGDIVYNGVNAITIQSPGIYNLIGVFEGTDVNGGSRAVWIDRTAPTQIALTGQVVTNTGVATMNPQILSCVTTIYIRQTTNIELYVEATTAISVIATANIKPLLGVFKVAQL